jgi:crotonobetainyl-CoA hydratase
MEIILTSRKYTADEGLRMGFVNKVVTHDKLMDVVKKYCDDILKGAPLAIQASKMTLKRGLSEDSLKTALAKQESYHEFIKWRNSDDAAEGVKAFSEKRKPHWTGS